LALHRGAAFLAAASVCTNHKLTRGGKVFEKCRSMAGAGATDHGRPVEPLVEFPKTSARRRIVMQRRIVMHPEMGLISPHKMRNSPILNR
jgi:hypothetical protein